MQYFHKKKRCVSFPHVTFILVFLLPLHFSFSLPLHFHNCHYYQWWTSAKLFQFQSTQREHPPVAKHYWSHRTLQVSVTLYSKTHAARLLRGALHTVLQNLRHQYAPYLWLILYVYSRFAYLCLFISVTSQANKWWTHEKFMYLSNLKWRLFSILFWYFCLC